MRILTRKKYFTLYNRAIKDTLLYLEICFQKKITVLGAKKVKFRVLN